ncbi:uridine kinase [Fulvivirgaceae bacterium PWU5]|uniref:Uridine kinase n=1 Tax=Dawidia cretensis TaxID=2782350 RepID=A0AAP2DY40_9BACT|nr:uridine kinase [Dawidia cretensis]MBT1709775.1 uridine kinase [Dawidia cretensis]
MKPVYTIGITGGSGSGKTHFIKQLAGRFQPNEICLISQDHYYKPIHLQVRDTEGIENFDLPEAIDREAFHEDLLKLKRGETLLKQEYVFNNVDANPTILKFTPAPLLIIEGLFVQYFPEIEQELDLKLFIEAKDHLKLSRRIRRDSEERGYPLDDVLYRYQHHVMPIYEAYIKPLMHKADLVIPNNHHFERALDLLTLALKHRISQLES